MKKVFLTVVLSVSLIFPSAALATFNGVFGPDTAKSQKIDPVAEKRIQAELHSLRLPFVQNENQTDNTVKYYANTFAGTVFVSDNEITYSLPGAGKNKGWVIKEKLVHAKTTKVQGRGKAETKVHYFKGNDPKKWRSNIPTFHSVSLGEVYKDIELVHKAYGSNVEKVFTVGKGAAPEDIRVEVQGTDSLKVNDKGELEMETGLGTVTMSVPVAYQEINGKTISVSASYSIHKRNAIHEYGFRLGTYNKDHPVIIDPLLASTFAGGSDDEYDGIIYLVTPNKLIALDSSGNVYVTGYTFSSDYPTTVGAYDQSHNGDCDVFVSKFDSDLSTLSASTLIGSSGDDWGYSISIDPSGSLVYITGYAGGNDYPTTPGAYDESRNGYCDVIVSKLDSDLSTLSASTFIGGTDYNFGNSIGLDRYGDVYVTGYTYSSNYPTTPGAYDQSHNGYYDVFISKLDGNLSTLSASTFIGGAEADRARSIAIDQNDNVYVTGRTESSDYPTTAGAYDESSNGDHDVFISKFDSDLSTLSASTFIGDTNPERGRSIAIDQNGNVYVTGHTSSWFPTTAGAYNEIHNGNYDAFVSKFDSDLSTLSASTLMGQCC